MEYVRDRVLKMLRDNILPGYGESERGQEALPQKAIEFATDESLWGFLAVNDQLQQMTGPGHYRTRAVYTSAIGMRYHIRAGRPRSTEIQSVLLPTGPGRRGCILAYLRGHDMSPITAPTCVNNPTGQVIAGRPVFLVTAPPTSELTAQLIAAFRASSLQPQ